MGFGGIMKVSTKTRYGFRFLINLGLEYNRGYLQVKEIADREKISEKYLEKIVAILKSSGLISVKRGAAGGYALVKSPAEITALEIFEILEGPVRLIDCLDNADFCDLKSSCTMTDFWNDFNQHTKAFLEQRTLEELVILHKKKNKISMYYI